MNDIYSLGELGAALLQAIITSGLAGLLLYLYCRHRKSHFLWWSVALGARVFSVAAIVGFMLTGAYILLFIHQVFIAWTALGFFYAANVFSSHVAWRWRYLWALAIPMVWSYFAIFILDSFAIAAGVTVLLLALATIWAGTVFLRYRSWARSPAAGFLALVLMLWAVHHLDYPFVRAMGAWNPWGYYVDILFVLAMGAGILLLVIEEQREGLITLAALSGSNAENGEGDLHAELIERPLGLRGVRGAALLRAGDGAVELVRGVGDCAAWMDYVPCEARALIQEVVATGHSRLEGRSKASGNDLPFAAVLPLGGAGGQQMVLIIVGDVAAPFAALDDSILDVVGQQVGSAMERADLTRHLAQRTRDLERLSVRMLRDHEDQRHRLGRELHDETAQVFSALKMQLGLLREDGPVEMQSRFDRLVEWVDRGSMSIRNATDGLRPSVLDDLGLLPALRTLARDLGEWGGLLIDFDSREWPSDAKRLLDTEAELALFRALQETLSNVVRHARASQVSVVLALRGGSAYLRVADDGAGLEPAELARLASGEGRSGIFGMQERIASVGGEVRLSTRHARGLVVEAEIPVAGDSM